jgi:FKBP-type peptidyl-prolyl cis-trans isomerase FkpA
MTIKLSLLAALICAVALSACGGNSAPEPYLPNDWKPFVYVGPTVVTKTEMVVGIGAEAVEGKSAKVLVTRWLYDAAAPEFKGSKYESMVTNVPAEPFSMKLELKSGAPALADAIVGMKVGGKRSAVVPGDMRPGVKPNLPPGVMAYIPAPREQPYVADIELLEVN